MTPVVPPKTNRIAPWSLNPVLYSKRLEIEDQTPFPTVFLWLLQCRCTQALVRFVIKHRESMFPGCRGSFCEERAFCPTWLAVTVPGTRLRKYLGYKFVLKPLT